MPNIKFGKPTIKRREDDRKPTPDKAIIKDGFEIISSTIKTKKRGDPDRANARFDSNPLTSSTDHINLTEKNNPGKTMAGSNDNNGALLISKSTNGDFYIEIEHANGDQVCQVVMDAETFAHAITGMHVKVHLPVSNAQNPEQG